MLITAVMAITAEFGGAESRVACQPGSNNPARRHKVASGRLAHAFGPWLSILTKSPLGLYYPEIVSGIKCIVKSFWKQMYLHFTWERLITQINRLAQLWEIAISRWLQLMSELPETMVVKKHGPIYRIHTPKFAKQHRYSVPDIIVRRFSQN